MDVSWVKYVFFAVYSTTVSDGRTSSLLRGTKKVTSERDNLREPVEDLRCHGVLHSAT